MASMNLTVKFEYKTIEGKLSDSQLNQLGSDGWELKHLEVRRKTVLNSVIVIYEYLFMREVP